MIITKTIDQLAVECVNWIKSFPLRPGDYFNWFERFDLAIGYLNASYPDILLKDAVSVCDIAQRLYRKEYYPDLESGDSENDEQNRI